ncbi:MAG: pyridoxal phosphate-dependent aminotransferase [Bacteroidetes bacterium]|nr:pyridoxal phosphate-dependent aminotransferase [Bacteroidota bacterium]
MIQLSDRLAAMEESATIAMSKKSRELKDQGKDIISLSLGEPDFFTPQFIKDAAIQALEQNYTQYTPVSGYEDLRLAISEKFKRDNGLTYGKDQIVVSTGAKQAIANVMLSVLNRGDEAIILAPYWVSYVEMVKVAEGTPVIVSAGIEQDFKVTAEQLQKAITSKTKLLVFSSPCNPTGSVYKSNELKAIADVLAQHPQIVIIADEIYEHIRFEGEHVSIASFENIYPQVVTVNGVSKAWAMTGWRLGYIGASKQIAAACDKVQGQFTSATCSIAQRAAIAALKADPIVLKEMVQAFKNRRDLVIDLISKIDRVKCNVPPGAFYVFPDVSALFGTQNGNVKITNANDLCLYLLAEALVAVVPGDAFGEANCIRFSYATSENILLDALTRVKKAIDLLK